MIARHHLWRRKGMEARTFLTKTAPTGLTPRQRQVLLRLIKGDTEKEMAHVLLISIHTVHVYVKALYRQYNVRSRGELLGQCIDRLLQSQDGELASVASPNSVQAFSSVLVGCVTEDKAPYPDREMTKRAHLLL
jgi:DNA-binding CsgD family transcriptional regulator